MTDRLSPYLTEVWLAVASMGKAMTAPEYGRTPEVAGILRRHHGQAKTALDKLAKGGYLRRASNSFQSRYWHCEGCKVPHGCVASSALPAGSERASTRNFVNALMPTDTTPLHRPMGGSAFDFRQHPSRCGDRLYFKNGRITDLEGNTL